MDINNINKLASLFVRQAQEEYVVPDAARSDAEVLGLTQSTIGPPTKNAEQILQELSADYLYATYMASYTDPVQNPTNVDKDAVPAVRMLNRMIAGQELNKNENDWAIKDMVHFSGDKQTMVGHLNSLIKHHGG